MSYDTVSHDTGGSASLLTTASTVRCPHGGSVGVAAGSSGSVRVAGARLASAADAFTVTGCPHTDGGRPAPCTTVRFTEGHAGGAGGARVFADGRPVLLSTSAAQCYTDDLTPQGPPVTDGAAQGVSCR